MPLLYFAIFFNAFVTYSWVSALWSFVTLGFVRSQNTLNPLLLPRTPPEPATSEGCGPRPAGKAPRVSEFNLSAGHVDRGLVPLN